MKLTSAFKIKELALIMISCLGGAILITALAPQTLFQVAHFFWVPFLILSFLLLAQYRKTIVPISNEAALLGSSVSFNIILAFLIILFCYFGLGQGLLLYQILQYNTQEEPVFTQISNIAQLLWMIKLTLITWVIASGLFLSMAVAKHLKISGFMMQLLARRPHFSLVIDGLVVFSFITFLLMFIVMGNWELVRSITAFLGYERPTFPDLTAIILILVLFTGYFILKIKKRMQGLAQKPVSIGRVLTMQSLWVFIFLILGQGIIIFFPKAMIMPLMKPIFIFNEVDFRLTWYLITLAVAVASAVLLARYFAYLFAGRTVAQAFLMLSIMPLITIAAIVYFSPDSFDIKTYLYWIPPAYFLPITIDNVIYQPGMAQGFLILSVVTLLLCFWRSKLLQLALIDLMPKHIGFRGRRLRKTLSNQTIALFFLAALYLFSSHSGYYFFSNILLVFITLSLLWVSLTVFYNLTKFKVK